MMQLDIKAAVMRTEQKIPGSFELYAFEGKAAQTSRVTPHGQAVEAA